MQDFVIVAADNAAASGKSSTALTMGDKSIFSIA
jgi:cytidylate kinase